jgi:hypothetical protein
MVASFRGGLSASCQPDREHKGGQTCQARDAVQPDREKQRLRPQIIPTPLQKDQIGWGGASTNSKTP